MKTKHILTALAVPMFFAACADDQFENEGVQSLLKNRPMVGQVTFHDENVESRLVNPTTGAMEFKNGDAFGMLGMDEVSDLANGNANIGSRYYKLANKAFTNYQFVKDGSMWSSESELMEGNYFYYLPYTSNQKDANKTKVTRDGGLQWVIAEKQNAFTADAPTVLAPFNATKDNQLYVGYQALNSDEIATSLEAKLAVVHPTVLFEIENAGSSDVTIERIVLESTEADNGFGVKGCLDVANGIATSELIYTNNSTNLPADVKNQNIAKVFGAYNNAVQADRDNFLKNPFAKSNFIKTTTPDAGSISLSMPSVSLASGKTVSAEMVVPADAPSTMNVRIYTNKGVVLVPVKTDDFNTKVEEGLVQWSDATATKYSASVSLTKRNTDPEVPGYFNTAVDYFVGEWIPNNWNTISISFNEDAIQIPGKMDIYSTEDLNAFMGYCKLNDNLSLKSYALTAYIKSEGVELSKEAYSVLKTYPKIDLTVDGTLTIPADVEKTALDRISWAADSKVIIAEGAEQTITRVNAAKIANLSIVNKGTLNVNATYDNGAHYTITLAGLANYGTLNINTPLTVAAIYNGSETELTGGLATAAYNAVVTDAVVNAAAKVDGKICNLGVVNVKASIKIATFENHKVTLKGSDPVKSKYGKMTIEAGKQLTTKGKNDGEITVNGILTAYDAFDNNATIYNNYGLENVAGQKLNNTDNGYIVVAADAKFTAVNDNTGTIEILKRSTQVNSDNNIGKILYTAEAGETFTVKSSDKFNTVKFNEDKTLEIEHSSKYPYYVVPAALNRAKDLTVLIAAEGNYAFAEYTTNDDEQNVMQIAGIEISANKYATIISNVNVTESFEIKSGATVQLDKYNTINYNKSEGFVNGGTFRNLGTLNAMCDQPSGNWTGSGSYSWGNINTGATATLKAEIAKAITTGGTVVLNESVILSEPLVFESATRASTTKKVTLNLNGKKLSNEKGNVIVVKAGVELTIEGNGIVYGSESNGFGSNAVIANGGKVVIKNGTFKVGGDNSKPEAELYKGNFRNDCIYAISGGHITIEGGHFEYTGKRVIGNGNEYQDDGRYFLLNKRDNSGSSIIVKAGTFIDFNPAYNIAEPTEPNDLVDSNSAVSKVEQLEADGTWKNITGSILNGVAFEAQAFGKAWTQSKKYTVSVK